MINKIKSENTQRPTGEYRWQISHIKNNFYEFIKIRSFKLFILKININKPEIRPSKYLLGQKFRHEFNLLLKIYF